MLRIGIIGECMIELFDQGNGQCKRGFGGDTLNTAVYMTRCGAALAEAQGAEALGVHYVTALGDDAISEDMVRQWQSEGVNTDTVEQIAGTVPGLYMIQTDAQGERSFLYWRDQAPVKQLFQTPNAKQLTDQLMGFDWIYFSGITLAVLETAGREALLKLLDRFREKGGTVVFDVNYRPRLWQQDDPQHWIKEAYLRADIALPSVDDEIALWDGDGEKDHSEADESSAALTRLESFGCGEIVLKRGSESCLVSAQGIRTKYPVTPATSVVDTTAAGDSFNAAYLAARMQQRSIEQAIAAGQQVASQVIAKQGAIVPIAL